MANPSPFAKRLAAIAEDQHRRFRLMHEHDPLLARQIETYWRDLGMAFPGVSIAWSAVFISWCVLKAGATSSEFLFAQAHSRFVHRAIKNATAGTGVFQGFDIAAYAPAIGDILQNNRGGNTFTFAFASTHSQYESHSAIVVETGQDSGGRYLLTVGGNEGDSVGMKLVRLTAAGLVKQRPNSPFISVIQNLKV